MPEHRLHDANVAIAMNDISSDVNLKATAGAVVIYATVMGLLGAYWALQCGSHWFTYSVISFLPYAVIGVVGVYFALIWLLSNYDFGQVKYWVLAGALAALFFLGCFVFAHLQPPIQLYNGTNCQPL